MASTRWTQVVLSIAAAAMLVSAAGLALAADGHEARALTNCSVSDYSLDSEEMAFLGLINQYRADNGLGALTISTNLNRAAHWMGNDLGVNNYFAHTDSLGRSPYSRAIDCGYPAGAGENLAAGSAWDTAQEAFVAWQNSPGHNANMLGTYYKQIGIARVQVPGSQYTWYWVTNFGATDDGTGGGGQPTNTPTPTNTSVPATATPTKTSVPADRDEHRCPADSDEHPPGPTDERRDANEYTRAAKRDADECGADSDTDDSIRKRRRHSDAANHTHGDANGYSHARERWQHSHTNGHQDTNTHGNADEGRCYADGNAHSHNCRRIAATGPRVGEPGWLAGDRE